MQEQIIAIKKIFKALGYKWSEPYETTEGAINRKEVGFHRGLYYIYPEVNFYFGKAASTKGSGTIYHRHLTHRPKLDVNLAALYGSPKIKCQPKWQFPKGFKEGVSKFLLKNNVPIPIPIPIPDHFINFYNDNGKKMCKPGILNFPVKHKIDIDTLPVLVWNLDDFSTEAIKKIEKSVITTIWPYCNNETYRRRH